MNHGSWMRHLTWIFLQILRLRKNQTSKQKARLITLNVFLILKNWFLPQTWSQWSLKKTKCYQDESSRASARPERPKFGRRNQSHLWNHFWVSLLQTCFYAAMFYSSFLMPVLLCDAVLFLALLLCLFALLTWLFNKVSLFSFFFLLLVCWCAPPWIQQEFFGKFMACPPEYLHFILLFY